MPRETEEQRAGAEPGRRRLQSPCGLRQLLDSARPYPRIETCVRLHAHAQPTRGSRWTDGRLTLGWLGPSARERAMSQTHSPAPLCCTYVCGHICVHVCPPSGVVSLLASRTTYIEKMKAGGGGGGTTSSPSRKKLLANMREVFGYGALWTWLLPRLHAREPPGVYRRCRSAGATEVDP
jgi:hypothetical protein